MTSYNTKINDYKIYQIANKGTSRVRQGYVIKTITNIDIHRFNTNPIQMNGNNIVTLITLASRYWFAAVLVNGVIKSQEKYNVA